MSTTTSTTRRLAGIPSTISTPAPPAITVTGPPSPFPSTDSTGGGSGYNGGSGGGTVNSTLYLFTFLTTLLLLLAVS
ncbi:hypothetical protein FRC09_002768, partial [Ceratobasidium sp. 395]